jgi:hypothetical protein
MSAVSSKIKLTRDKENKMSALELSSIIVSSIIAFVFVSVIAIAIISGIQSSKN